MVRGEWGASREVVEQEIHPSRLRVYPNKNLGPVIVLSVLTVVGVALAGIAVVLAGLAFNSL